MEDNNFVEIDNQDSNFVEIDAIVDDADLSAEAVCACGCLMCFCRLCIFAE